MTFAFMIHTGIASRSSGHSPLTTSAPPSWAIASARYIGLRVRRNGPSLQLLLLDEPNNHLDRHALEAVARVLGGFAGALVLVSHDRAFRADVGVTREVRLWDGRLVSHDGSRGADP